MEGVQTAHITPPLTQRDRSTVIILFSTFDPFSVLDDAIANLEIAHSVKTPSAASLSLLGDLYLSQDAFTLALNNYKYAIQRDPKINPKQALKPLRQLMQLALYQEARDYLNLINGSLQSQYSPAQAAEKTVFDAQLQIRAGDAALGLVQLQKVLDEQPLNGAALLLMADVQLEREAYEEAVFYFERAKSAPEAQVEALIGLGRTAVAQAKFKDAIKLLQQSQRIKQRKDVTQFIASIQRVVAAQ